MSKCILLVDDDLQLLRVLSAFFERRGWTVVSAPDGRAGVERYRTDAPDVVLADLSMPGLSGLQLVDVMRAHDPEAVVVLLTGHGDVAQAVEALRLGAEDFLLKPVDYAHLEVVVDRALERARLRRRALWAGPETAPALAEFGSTPAMVRIGEQVQRVARGTAPVLVGGETGTGKGWLAQRLHELSPRAAMPFVELNCAGLTPTFLDAELFGHEQGAFTDAKRAKRGLFEIADGGTLFLDEIGDLAPELQPKLLKVLESQRFRRLGGTREIAVDVRLVAATNVSLHDAMRAGRFREDLYYRLAVVPLEMPPLRDRGSVEIARLAHALLDHLRRNVPGGPAHLHPDAMAALVRYPWPGNIRELRNVLERVLLLAEGADAITPAHLPPEIRAVSAGSMAADEQAILPLAEVERAHVLRVLAALDYNKSQAARALGITRGTLYAKLREYGLGALANAGPDG